LETRIADGLVLVQRHSQIVDRGVSECLSEQASVIRWSLGLIGAESKVQRVRCQDGISFAERAMPIARLDQRYSARSVTIVARTGFSSVYCWQSCRYASASTSEDLDHGCGPAARCEAEHRRGGYAGGAAFHEASRN